MSIRWSRSISDPSELAAVARAGFDAAEYSITDLMTLGDRSFTHARTLLQESGVAVEVFSSPLPGQVRVTEDGFNIYVWSEYLKRALDRASALGCRFVVWNDGKARILPMEGSDDSAGRQALQFVYMLSEYADAHGMRVLVEPLDPRRTNYLNSLDEVADFLSAAGRANVSSVVSLRDADAIGLRAETVSAHAELISHVYLEYPGEPAGPRIPPRPDDGYDYQPFLLALAGIGYKGLITLPSGSDHQTLAFCRGIISD